MKRGILVAVIAIVLAGSVRPAQADSFIYDFGIGAGAVAANIFYIPGKLVYAILGGVTGGLTYLVTGFNYEVAERVWTPSLGGDYVVTRAHLLSEDVLYFSGTVPTKTP
jgi:hypothetical protein